MTVKFAAGPLPHHRIGACRLSPVRLWTRITCASLVALVLPLASLCQTPPAPDAQPMGGGNSTGGVHAAVHDAENRPITAGGFIATGPIVFEDATQKSGLGSFHHVMGTSEKKFIIETMGS